MKVLNDESLSLLHNGAAVLSNGQRIGHLVEVEHCDGKYTVEMVFDALPEGHDEHGLVPLGVMTHHGLFEFGIPLGDLEHVATGVNVRIALAVGGIVAGSRIHEPHQLP